ncbi:hypothetical protein A259_13665 [Pseudomonas syringae pv. actinidiae ICMP 19070]|nr:hypothetical protein A259_13665 [Pseudomonas syringae pv. actinidiae ICMP 19070]
MLQQRLGDGVAWHTQADGAALGVQNQARHFAGGIKNKGVRPWRVRLERTERAGVDLGKQPQLRQVAAHQGEVVLVVQLAQAADTLDGALVADLATQRVGGICRVDHQPAGFYDFRGLFDQARLRVFRMDLEKLTHVNFLFRRRQ